MEFTITVSRASSYDSKEEISNLENIGFLFNKYEEIENGVKEFKVDQSTTSIKINSLEDLTDLSDLFDGGIIIRGKEIEIDNDM